MLLPARGDSSHHDKLQVRWLALITNQFDQELVHLGWFIQITPSYLVYMVEIVYILWMVNFTGSYRLAAKKKELQS